MEIQRCFSVSLAVLCVLVLPACGPSSSKLDNDAEARGFSVTLLDSAYSTELGNTQVKLELVPQAGNNLMCQVFAHEARGLKAAYFSLQYDATRYTPQDVEAGSVLAELPGGELLELYGLDTPGRVDCGQCLAQWSELDGFSGNGLLATIQFTARPCTALRRASTAPDSALSQTTLNWDEPSKTLSWRYYNQGDCDQNGEVNIADLTPIGLYYRQTCSYPADANKALACADGDGNGEINIADIAPIGNNYGKDMLQGWRVYSSADPSQYPSSPSDGNGTATLQALLALDGFDPSTTRAADRLLYQVVLAGPAAGDGYWVRPVDSMGAEGIASNLAIGSSNTPPTATMYYAPAAGPAPLQVDFDASGSTDADGSIVSYDWDWEGDGNYEVLAGAAVLSNTYATDGIYYPTLRVTDDDGAQDLDQQLVEVGPVGPLWHVTTVATSSNVGKYSSLAEVGGCPAISYWDIQARLLMYVLASGTDGASWGTPVTVDTCTWNIKDGDLISMIVVQSAPSIAYCRDSKLYYVHAGDGSGSAWYTSIVVDEPNSGAWASMALVDGHPAISYLDRENDDLEFVRATDSIGSFWGTPVLVDGSGGVNCGKSSSLAVVGGYPMISYQYQSNQQLLLAYSTDVAGAAGTWTFVSPTVDWPVATYGTSLIDLSGLPAIAYSNEATSKLNFIRALDASLFAWSTPLEVAGSWPVSHGSWCSMELYNGAPAISYFADGSGWLEFSTATDGTGNVWNAHQDVDAPSPPESVGFGTSLAIIGGNPAISYHDIYNGDLKFAIYY